ncbi:hypothetical protein L596_007354 [Steinernema carpocapsae]|uniref:Tyrosine-protein phosphatase domain-containing protein n=1 Tax=Steinernema carpocapsae TaxID=34508 RepID=A0A4U5P913_STECR|nr:hypothetical protein L596_007354 [Steinernema carpocapsae]
MNGSTIVTIILAATLFVVVVTSVVFYVLRRRRRLHRVFLAGNIVESGYAGYIHHHSSDAKKRPNFHHARPFAVSPTPEDFLEMTEGDAASEKAKRGAGTPPEASPQASPQASPSPPSTEESTVEEELRQDASASPEHCGVYSAPVFHLDVTRLVERHNEHHVQSFDETSLSYAEFDASVSDLTTEDNGRLHREFKSLNRSLFGDQTTDEANHVKNLKRNRYLNVLPYDFNRVKLREDDGDGDYINATAIKAPNHHGIRYIAAQGPIGEDEPGRESTVVDFWRMIWEQRVECIVMLTDCVERRKAIPSNISF